MLSTKLLIAFAMVTGIAAEQCTMEDFSIQDVSSTVRITNASPDAWATVTLTFDHGQVSHVFEPGQSGTAIALASTTYTATVSGPENRANVSYRDRLLDLRNELLETLSSGAAVDQIGTVATDLAFVQSALQQLNKSTKDQSCSGMLKTGVVNQVRVNQTDASGVTVWVLDCS